MIRKLMISLTSLSRTLENAAPQAQEGLFEPSDEALTTPAWHATKTKHGEKLLSPI